MLVNRRLLWLTPNSSLIYKILHALRFFSLLFGKASVTGKCSHKVRNS